MGAVRPGTLQTAMPSSRAAARSTASVPMPHSANRRRPGNWRSTSPGHLTALRELMRTAAPRARRTFSSSVAGRSAYRVTRPRARSRSRCGVPWNWAGSSPGMTMVMGSDIGGRDVHVHHVHLKAQAGRRREGRRVPPFAVTQFGRDDQFALAAHLHAGDAFHPALDHPPRPTPQGEPGRLAGLVAAVELLAVLEAADVMHHDRVARLRLLAVAD